MRDEQLLSFALSSVGRLTTTMLMLDFNALANGVGPMGKNFDGPALRKALGHLERELKEGPEGGYFMGQHPGRADILLEFPMAMISQRGWVDLKLEFPALAEWLERCYSRAAWKMAAKKGHGYDLTTFAKRTHLSV